jgi:hypothetical protein
VAREVQRRRHADEFIVSGLTVIHDLDQTGEAKIGVGTLVELNCVTRLEVAGLKHTIIPAREAQPNIALGSKLLL